MAYFNKEHYLGGLQRGRLRTGRTQTLVEVPSKKKENGGRASTGRGAERNKAPGGRMGAA